MPEEDEGLLVLAEEIARYLKRHPRAADSLEGITTWWLTRQRYEETRDSVQQALDYLGTRGVVTRRVNPDGEVIYSHGGQG